MDTGKCYYDSEGNECSIWQIVQREPRWAAQRIQEGEKAEQRIRELTTLVESAYREGFYDGCSDEWHPQTPDYDWEHSKAKRELEPPR